MNKKVLTLCAGLLMGGTLLSPLEAITVSNQAQLEALIKNEVLNLPEGDNELIFKAGKYDIPGCSYLIVNKEGVTISSEGGVAEVTGRFVLSADGITVKGLNIINEAFQQNENGGVGAVADWSLFFNKTAISVLADKAIIENNTITCKPADENPNPNALANGITIYPKSKKTNYEISGNTIVSADITTPDSEWSASGIQIVENVTVADDYSASALAGIKKFTSANAQVESDVILDKNTFENCSVDYADYKANYPAPNYEDKSVYDVVQVTPIDGKLPNAFLKKVIVNSGKNVQIHVDAEALSVKDQLDEYATSENVAIQCPDGNILYGNVANPENGAPAIKVNADGTVIPQHTDITWSTDVERYTEDEKIEATNILVVAGQEVRAYREEGAKTSEVELANYDKHNADSKDENYALNYQWKFNVVETQPNKFELRLQDRYGQDLTIGDKYVIVDVPVTKNAEGYLYDGKKDYPETFILKSGQNFILIKDNKLTTNPLSGTTFGVAKISKALVEASTLLKRYGEYFTLDITYKKNEVGQTDLTGIFEGQLCPMSDVYYENGKTEFVKAGPTAKRFMLVNEKGEILAVNKNEDDRLSEGANNHVYPLTTITPSEYVLDQAGDQNYDVYFSLEYIPGQDAADVTAITNIWVEGNVIGCYLDKTVPTLAAADNVSLKKVSFDLNKGTLVDAASWLNQPAYYTVEVLNKAKDAAHKGQVLGLNENGAIDYVAATKTDINRPEGQFAISYNVNTGNYDFTNRETGETAWSLLMGDRLYKISSTEFAYLHGSHMDTLAIKPVTTYKSYDGFRRYSAADLNNNTYNIAMNLLDESFLYVVENHNDKHRIGLDREEATEWRIEIPTVKLLDAASDVKAIVADTVKVSTPIKYWKDNTWVYTDDKTSKNVDGSYKYYDPNTVLEICTYILKNTDTDEYMMGSSQAEEKANEYYYCPSKTQATRVALKLVGDSTVNLVPVYSNYWYEETDNYGNRWTVSFRNWNKDRSLNESQYNEYTSDPYSKLSLSENKIIGGTTSATGVLKDVALYQATSNDLFVIKDAAAPTYKKMEQGQKIVISREENNDEVIYEKGEFAGISNRVAYKDINPTLYVDTAYVNRDGNYRYEYLLGVNINRVDTVDDCGNPNHEHPRTVFTEGRFLVNMRDSADANTNVHNNKFEYDGESKLAFVAGYHQNDTLYITDEAGKVIAKSEVGNAAPHFAKFAFKMIDETNNEFVVEVGESAAKQYVYKNGSWTTVTNVEASRGYLKWHNGNLVVTPYLDQAEHFTMEASDKEATANEAISAGNVVVAGVDGAVVVKGAEGKNVIVSTILGKVVANEVVSSDNATIVAPAGIVVVSVDGESFKVVVK